MSKSRMTLVISIIVSMIAAIGGLAYYVMGRGKTHMEGLDFSNYSAWLLFFSAIAVFGLVLFLGMWKMVKPTSMGRGKPKGIKYKGFYYIGIALFFIGTLWCSIAFVSVLRAWNDNAKTADIAIATADSNDFTMSEAHVESFHEPDSNVLKWSRILSYDDQYKLVFSINCTNFTIGNDTVQLYNSTTATLKGYNILRSGVTGTLAPTVEPGDFTAAGGAKTIIFDDIPRQADSPDNAIAYFNLTLKNSAGAILASWRIDTDPRLGEWSATATV